MNQFLEGERHKKVCAEHGRYVRFQDEERPCPEFHNTGEPMPIDYPQLPGLPSNFLDFQKPKDDG